MTTVIDVVDMGYAFTALVVVIGVLLIAGPTSTTPGTTSRWPCSAAERF